MKKNLFGTFTILIALSMFFSCGSNGSGIGGDDDDEFNDIGVHRITIKITGDVESFRTMASFGTSGTSKLYNSEGELISGSNLLQENKTSYDIKTTAGAQYLGVAFSSIGDEGKELHVEFISYINGEKTNTLIKTFTKSSETIIFDTLKE